MIIRIVTPAGMLREAQCRCVLVRSRDAEFEVLDFHAPLVSIIEQGEVLIDGTDAVAVESGLCCVAEGLCLVMVEKQGNV